MLKNISPLPHQPRGVVCLSIKCYCLISCHQFFIEQQIFIFDNPKLLVFLQITIFMRNGRGRQKNNE